VPDRTGGLLRGARLGTALCAARPHGEADGAEVRGAVPQERQQRRGGNLRGGEPAFDALRAGEQRRATGNADAASGASGLRRERTATINRIRGLLAEFGVVLAQRVVEVRRSAAETLDQLPALAQRALRDLLARMRVLDERIGEYERADRATRAHG
jgi:hypothetical protein